MNSKKMIASALVAVASSTVFGYDNVVLDAAGINTLPSGANQYACMSNLVSGAEVTVKQADTAWNKFDTFEGVNASTTKLDNVRFDFGTTSASTSNFFPNANSGIANRLLEIGNGSIVTNVGLMFATRSTSYTDKNNAIRVTGGSSLSIAKAILAYDDPNWKGGASFANNGASFTLDGGSYLYCKGAFQTGNSLGWDTSILNQNIWARFLGEGTKATVGGSLTIGDAGRGGHHAVVADGASVSVASVTIGGTGTRTATYDNSLVISNGGSIVSKGFSLSISRSVQSNNARPVGDSLQVLDGGSFVNSGNFYVGWYDSSSQGKWSSTILVSNGTFRTSGGEYRFGTNPACSNHQFIVSGPRANVSISGGYYYYFLGGKFNRYIFENEADYTTSYSSYSYTTDVANEEIRVRTGATFRFAKAFSVAALGSSATVSDSRFVVESGATATGAVFRVGGRNNTLVVSNGKVKVSGHGDFYYAFDIGNADHGAVNTNAHLVISGDTPQIISQSGALVSNGSDVTFELPAAGYAAGIVPITLDNSFNLNRGCSLNFSGAQAMLNSHAATGKKASYTLIKALNVNLPDGEMERLNASLPTGMSLRKTKNAVIARESLILDVKPSVGFIISIQ